MSHKSRGLKVLSLAFLAVAGLMAFMASGAQASAEAWLENGADIAANKLVEVGIHTEGLLDVDAQNLIIHCASVSGHDILLLAGTTLAHGELLYSNCSVLQNGVLSTACDKHLNGAKVEGLLEPIVAKFIAHLELNAEKTKTQILFEPATGLTGTFAVVRFDPSCALPETNNVKGSLLVECLTSSLTAGNCLTEELTHLLKQGSEATDKLTYGTNPAKLLGIAKAKLASDNPWAGHV